VLSSSGHLWVLPRTNLRTNNPLRNNFTLLIDRSPLNVSQVFPDIRATQLATRGFIRYDDVRYFAHFLHAGPRGGHWLISMELGERVKGFDLKHTWDIGDNPVQAKASFNVRIWENSRDIDMAIGIDDRVETNLALGCFHYTIAPPGNAMIRSDANANWELKIARLQFFEKEQWVAR